MTDNRHAEGRQGGLRQLQKAFARSGGDAPGEGSGSARDEVYVQRVTIQQFLNENAALFDILAKTMPSADDFLKGADFRCLAEQALSLSVETAKRVLGKDQVDAWDVRPFRAVTARFVAECWKEGMDVDVAGIADGIAAAVRLADPKLDVSLFKQMRVSDHASLAMTSGAVATRLVRAVMIYDFRHDRAELVAQLAGAVVNASAEATGQMLPDGSSDDDRRSLLQTMSNRMADVMEACYMRKAREVISTLDGLPESSKADWYRENDPVGDLLASFGEWARIVGATALAFARNTTKVKDAPDIGRAFD